MRHTGRRVVVGGAVALLLVPAAGCGQGEEDATVATGRPADFAATPRYLTAVVDDSANQPYRFEMSMGTDAPGTADDQDVPVMTGAFDGERTQVLMDMSDVAARGEPPELPPGVTPDDLVVEVVTGPDRLYMRAPLFRALLARRPASELGPPGFADLIQALANGWVSVDRTVMGNLDPLAGAATLAGSQTFDPAAYLDVLGSTGAVEDLGRDQIGDVPVVGLAADVRFADLVRLRGRRPVAVPAAVANVMLPVEVWIDRFGHVRRVHVAFDMDVIGAALVEAGEISASAADEVTDTTLTQTLDLRDYGNEEIVVTPPAGAVDMTQAFADLCRGVGATVVRELPSPTATIPTLDGMDIDAGLAELEEMYAELEAMEPIDTSELDAAYAELDALAAEIPPPPEIPPELMEPPPPMPELPDPVVVPPELMEPPPPPPTMPLPPPPTLPPLYEPPPPP